MISARAMTFKGSIMLFGKRFKIDSPENIRNELAAEMTKMEDPLIMFTFVDAQKWAIDVEVTRELLDMISLGFLFDFLPRGKYTVV